MNLFDHVSDDRKIMVLTDEHWSARSVDQYSPVIRTDLGAESIAVISINGVTNFFFREAWFSKSIPLTDCFLARLFASFLVLALAFHTDADALLLSVHVRSLCRYDAHGLFHWTSRWHDNAHKHDSSAPAVSFCPPLSSLEKIVLAIVLNAGIWSLVYTRLSSGA